MGKLVAVSEKLLKKLVTTFSPLEECAPLVSMQQRSVVQRAKITLKLKYGQCVGLGALQVGKLVAVSDK